MGIDHDNNNNNNKRTEREEKWHLSPPFVFDNIVQQGATVPAEERNI